MSTTQWEQFEEPFGQDDDDESDDNDEEVNAWILDASGALAAVSQSNRTWLKRARR